MARRIPTIEVPKTANIPPGNITPTEWIEAKSQVEVAYTETTVLAALRFDPEHPMYGAQRGSLDTEPSSIVKAANRAAIQLAANDARDTGGTLVLKGTYWIDDTIQIQCHVDGASGTLLVSDTSINPAVLVGTEVTGQLSAAHVVLPRVRQRGKTGTGWSGNDVGVRISNCNQCHITVTHVHHFSTNIEMRAEAGGCCYNNIYLGISENGKIGLDFQTGPGGWVNENTFIGGRYHINSNEGEGAPGTRHIRVGASASGHAFNNNVFIKPSLEGAPEHNIEAGGVYNSVLYARWESPTPTVYFVDGANSWTFDGGYDSQRVQFVFAPGTDAGNTRIRTRQYEAWRAGGGNAGVMRLANSFSNAAPVLTIGSGGNSFWSKDLSTAYTVAIGSLYTQFKREADAHPRIEIDSANGRMYFGNGLEEPVGYISTAGSGTGQVIGVWDRDFNVYERLNAFTSLRVGPAGSPRIYGGTGSPEGVQAAIPGSMFISADGNWYRKASGTGNTGWVAMS